MVTPILGIVIGATLTVITVLLIIIIRIKRKHNYQDASPLEQKSLVGALPHSHNRLSSTKPLLRRCSLKEADERDPDIIPAKYGTFIFSLLLIYYIYICP